MPPSAQKRRADKSNFSPDTARGILSLQFSHKDKQRMHQISLKAKA